MYDYVAVKWSTTAWCDDRGFASAYARLRERGWEEHRRVQFERYVGGACIMRRPKREAREEARMWTKGEIKEIAGSVYMGFDIEKARDCRPVLNERAMQADLCGRLERRNGELQERLSERQETICAQRALLDDLQVAIDEMVRLSNPLTTKKEESNG